MRRENVRKRKNETKQNKKKEERVYFFPNERKRCNLYSRLLESQQTMFQAEEKQEQEN
jgi:hypothetical protein